MSTLPSFDLLSERVAAGDRLSDLELTDLSSTPDILRIGMLADTARQHRWGTRATYLRVASYTFDDTFSDPIPAAAREIRLGGSPATVKAALAAVERAKAAGDDRTIAGFTWGDVARLAASDGLSVTQVLSALRSAGLEALVEVALDAVGDPVPVLEELRDAGFDQVRLTIERAPASERTVLLLRAGALQERFGCIRALNPLPSSLQPFRPTTGYDDVRSVAVARLAAPSIPTIQVDWRRYGPKLAQVALTFGADDLDAVSAVAEAPDGPRRAPMEELRRNIEAAGLTPAERDGRFNLVS